MVRKFPWRRLCVARWEQREAQSGWRTLQARLEKLPARQLDKVKSNNEAHSVEAQREKESPLCHTDGHLSSQNSELEPKKVPRPSRAPRWHCMRRFRCTRSLYWTGLVCVTNDGRKSDGCHWKTSWLCRTSWRCSSAHQNFSKSRSHSVHIFLDTSSTTLMTNIIGKHWRSSCSSRAKFTRTSICWALVRKTVRGGFIGTWIGKSSELGMSIRSSETRIVLVGLRWWHQNGWKKAEYGSNVEEFDETCGSWRTSIISWPCVFGMYSTWM